MNTNITFNNDGILNKIKTHKKVIMIAVFVIALIGCATAIGVIGQQPLMHLHPANVPLCPEPSITTVSGSATTNTPDICPGDLIFEDTFDSFDLKKWNHENTLAGGGNWEFQWYTNNRSNSFVKDGHLHIRPTLTTDVIGEIGLISATINIHGGSPGDQCTNPAFYGCERAGNPTHIINPIRSARIRTVNSFAFKYGKVEVRAKLPTGDWLWPAIWFLPKDNSYGTWPASGEIDLCESRGNLNLELNGKNIGAERIGSTLHFGPHPLLNGFETATFSKNSPPGQGFNADFHRYQMEWTPEMLRFSVDDIEVGNVAAGSGFFARGGFENRAPGTDNPWQYSSKMAPFDQEFYMVMNVAVGGVNGFFPDAATNPTGKPWKNNSPQAAKDFWDGRNDWLASWKLDEKYSEEASLLVDYVRVWAL